MQMAALHFCKNHGSDSTDTKMSIYTSCIKLLILVDSLFNAHQLKNTVIQPVIWDPSPPPHPLPGFIKAALMIKYEQLEDLQMGFKPNGRNNF